MEDPSLFFVVLGQSVGEQAVGGVVHHDMGPLPALHGVDRGQRDAVDVGRGAQLVRQPSGEQTGIGLQVGQLRQGVEIVAVGRTGALAPLVEGGGTGVQSAVTDLGPEHGQDGGRRSRPGRPPHPADVVAQVAHLPRFPLAAFVLEPPGQADQFIDRTLSAHQVEQRRTHPPLRSSGHLAQHGSRKGVGRRRGHGQPGQGGPHAAALEEALAHPAGDGDPAIAQDHLDRGQRRVDPGQDGDVVGSGASFEKIPHTTTGPSGGTVVAGQDGQAPGVMGRPVRGSWPPGSPWPPAEHCGSTGSMRR